MKYLVTYDYAGYCGIPLTQKHLCANKSQLVQAIGEFQQHKCAADLQIFEVSLKEIDILNTLSLVG